MPCPNLLSEQGNQEPRTGAESRGGFALILKKLARRDHTEKELAAALALKGYGQEAIDAALNRARRQGLVDDAAFASRLARATASAGKRGPLRLIATLRRKGIEAATAEAAAKDAFSSLEDAESRLVRLASQLLDRARGATLKEKKIKVVRSLIGRGFSLAEAKRALRLAENARDDRKYGT